MRIYSLTISFIVAMVGFNMLANSAETIIFCSGEGGYIDQTNASGSSGNRDGKEPPPAYYILDYEKKTIIRIPYADIDSGEARTSKYKEIPIEISANNITATEVDGTITRTINIKRITGEIDDYRRSSASEYSLVLSYRF